MFKNKRCVVTGGTGLIGSELVKILQEQGAMITTASLDKAGLPGVKHVCVDLTEKYLCRDLCENQDYIFHLSGIKGSPQAAKYRPASFFVPMIQFNANMMEAALNARCEHYLYTSSIGVYAQSQYPLKEENTEITFPSPNDFYAGMAKRCGEYQAKAYEIQHGWTDYSIIRPAAIYGPRDNFDPINAMVIPTLVYKLIEYPDSDLEMMGNGENVRDYLTAKDCARAMLFMVENKLKGPCNVGSGVGITIKQLVEKLVEITEYKGNVIWKGGPSGDKTRVLDMTKLKTAGFRHEVSLEEGLRETVEWYRANRKTAMNRHNYFVNA